jgi:hypothetical protein
MPVCGHVNAPRKTSNKISRRNLPLKWIELNKHFDRSAIYADIIFRSKYC